MAALPSRELMASEIGRRVRQHREAQKWTRGELASFTRVREETIRAIEAGEQVPRFDTAARLAAALGCKTEDLLPSDYRKVFSPENVIRVWAEELMASKRAERRPEKSTGSPKKGRRHGKGAAGVVIALALASTGLKPGQVESTGPSGPVPRNAHNTS